MCCPCHSGHDYRECCQPYHEGKDAPTPEKLMRSRYAAYALGLVDYIVQTQAMEGDLAAIESFCTQTEFRDLKIVRVEPTHVTFHATLFQGGHDLSFTERSAFERRGEGWIYTKKTALP